MSFFKNFTAQADQIGGAIQGGASIGAALAGLSDGGVGEEVDKNIDLFAGINARRIEREMRYLQGQARAQMAQNGGNHGSNVFIAASNARRAEERRQDALVQAERQKVSRSLGQPSKFESGLNATLTILGAGLNAADRNLRRRTINGRIT